MRTALALEKSDLDKGLATHSSGNHGQAVAKAAQTLQVPAHIVMPKAAPEVKKAGVRTYGAQIHPCENTLEAREQGLQAVCLETGATFIHPFDNYNVIAGQATASLEFWEEVPDMMDILAPVGGGGLMSGTCLTSHYLQPQCRVFGTEPWEVNDAARSFKSGQAERNETTNTIADGLKTSLSAKTRELILHHAEDILEVQEDQIIKAMRLIWTRLKIIVEPSAAVPLAALSNNRHLFEGRKVGIIISGGNVDLEQLPWN